MSFDRYDVQSACRDAGANFPAVAPPPSSPSQLDMIVIGELRAVTRTMPGVLAKLFEDFIADSQRRLKRIEGAKNRDLRVVRFEAHTLKGASGAVGTTELMRLSGMVERYARVGVWSDELYEQLRTAFLQASAQLRELMATL